MKSLYSLSAIQYDLTQSEPLTSLRSSVQFGYFTNLKKVHSVLKGKNVPGYSTVARRIKGKRFVIIENVDILIGKQTIKTRRIVLRVWDVNTIYVTRKYIDIESLIIGEVFKTDLSLSTSLS
jgi:hypothetical protein